MDDLFNTEQVAAYLAKQHAHCTSTSNTSPTLPAPLAIQHAESQLPSPSSPTYLQSHPQKQVVDHIARDIVPALCGQASSSRYYGFVTGGTLPLAEWADNVVSRVDQNVQVHLPLQTVSTSVEDAALRMVADLLGLQGDIWRARALTTGATGSNVLGLACGRESIIAKRLRDTVDGGAGVGELGLLAACLKAGVSEIQVLTSAGHSSLSKAASVVGLGRASVKELRCSDEPWRLDLEGVERELARPGTASIIAISAGEVNTGRFGLNGQAEMVRLRELADRYNAWIHVDGAFGIFARVLGDGDEFKTLSMRAQGLELADSITVDGHKILNVPYDCGLFFTRSISTLQSVFTNPNAAYLSSGALSSIPSPLNLGLENSRRFRALPLYAVLMSEGRPGIERMVSNMVRLSRRVAHFIRDSPDYELLPSAEAPLDEIFMIVLFRARDPAVNEVLVERINGTRQMYVSGTAWKGEKAVRIAVSNWMVNVERDYEVVTDILKAVAEGRDFVVDEQ